MTCPGCLTSKGHIPHGAPELTAAGRVCSACPGCVVCGGTWVLLSLAECSTCCAPYSYHQAVQVTPARPLRTGGYMQGHTECHLWQVLSRALGS